MNGWYKSNIQKITVVISFAVAVGFNIDTIHVVKRISSDKNLRQAIVAKAEAVLATESQKSFTTQIAKDSVAEKLLEHINGITDSLNKMGFPIGWNLSSSKPSYFPIYLKNDTAVHKKVPLWKQYYATPRSFVNIWLLAQKQDAVKDSVTLSVLEKIAAQPRAELRLKELSRLKCSPLIGSEVLADLVEATLFEKEHLGNFKKVTPYIHTWLRINNQFKISDTATIHLFDSLSKTTNLDHLIKDLNDIKCSSAPSNTVASLLLDSIYYNADTISSIKDKVVLNYLENKPDEDGIGGTVSEFFNKFLHHSFRDWLIKLLGWTLTAIALSFGAPFWFDLLVKLVNIRKAGLKPDEKPKI